MRAFVKEGAAKGLTTRQSSNDRTKPHRFGWTATQAFFVPTKGASFEYHKGVLLVIELRQKEINQVGGGMKWCYGEMSDNVIVDGSVSEDTRMQWAVGGGCGGLRDNIPHLDFFC
ncbi:hypothetical protein [Dyella sp. C9]|uniref:hypothetical protein n=1 Tax=Dyella sp. C9 TaxID=2202154 RepID=UPI001E4CBA26|nr:hypothetical protein [Dyella sp. C9]